MSAETEQYWPNLIKAIQLLEKHKRSNWPFNCSHDMLWVNSNPDQFTPEEIAQLDDWGFSVDEDRMGFYSFVYGSC